MKISNVKSSLSVMASTINTSVPQVSIEATLPSILVPCTPRKLKIFIMILITAHSFIASSYKCILQY